MHVRGDSEDRRSVWHGLHINVLNNYRLLMLWNTRKVAVCTVQYSVEMSFARFVTFAVVLNLYLDHQLINPFCIVC